MADRNQLKVADHHGIADDDPFAELTRIMGFDPREPVRPQTPVQAVPADAVDDAFGIDLEKELMGELAGFDDEPVAAPAAIEPQVEAQAPQVEWDSAPADAVEAAAGDGFDLDAAMDEQVAASLYEDFSVEDEAEQPAEYEAYVEPESEDTADEQVLADENAFDDVTAEDFSVAPQDTETVGDDGYAVAAEAAPVSGQGASDDDFAAYFDGAMADVDMDFAARPVESEAVAQPVHDDVVKLDDALGAVDAVDEQYGEAVDEPVFEHVAEQSAFEDTAYEPESVVAYEPEPVAAAYVDDQPVADESSVQDIDFRGAFDEHFAADPVAEAPQPVAAEQSQPAPALHESTLEDELNALLNRMTARPAASEPAIAAVSEAAAQAAEEPPVSYHEHDPEALDAALLADLQALDFDDIAVDAHEQEAATAPAAESNWTWSRGTPLAQAPVAEPRATAPEPVSDWQGMAQRPYTYGTQTAAPVASAEPAAPAAAPRSEMPDVETVDVPERVVALADDLDLPELSFEQDEPESVAYDDLDAEFSGLIGTMAAPEPEPAAPRAAAYEDDPYVGGAHAQYEAPAYAAAAVVAASAGSKAAEFGPAGFAASRPRAGHDPLPVGELDYDPDLDEVNTVPDVAEGAALPRNRVLLAAAVIGAVAIVGGIGAFALSPGSSGSDAPAIVKADNQPIKVKPENPGGTVIPNQDNKVYEAVNGVKAADPKQEKLVTDAQEPMDVTQSAGGQPESRVVDLSPDNDAGPAVPAPKSEDRIEQAAAPEADAGNKETALVTPRKVRTMVVKPDGSLVPREEQAPAKVAATEPADPAPQHVDTSGDQTGAVPSAAANEPAAAESAAPAQSSATPKVAPVAPQRPSDQPVDIVGEVKPDQVAALDQGAPAAGSWSMQIASQPTAESAQATYQDLARRYASVLDGHTASIVKAEIAGKGTFYRVRVPAPSRNDAIKLCESYKAAGGNCFVSK